jgi:hypothetical protein
VEDCGRIRPSHAAELMSQGRKSFTDEFHDLARAASPGETVAKVVQTGEPAPNAHRINNLRIQPFWCLELPQVKSLILRGLSRDIDQKQPSATVATPFAK